MLTTQKQVKVIEVPQRPPQLTEEKRIEKERIRDVLLLLENLAIREEVTVKLILDCLYDIGSVNLINKKFRSQPLNRIMKFIAKLTKPGFRIVAFRWFRRNAPQLITNFLYSKVKSAVANVR